MWSFYALLLFGAVVIFHRIFPTLYPLFLRPAARSLARWTAHTSKRIFHATIRTVARAAIVVWNSPVKILIFVFEFPARILIGLVVLFEIVIKAIPKIPSYIAKILHILWRPDSEEKESEDDVLEEMLNIIHGYQFGPPLSKLEIHHLFYIGYYNQFNHVAPSGVIEKALGAYIIRRNAEELPSWIQPLIERYKSDRSIEKITLPPRPKFRRSLVANWFIKHPKAINTIDDLEELPWWIRTLVSGHFREKVDTIQLIERSLNKSLPENIRMKILA